MKKMRDMYAVSFIKLVDSAWMPKAEMKTFKGFNLRGSDDHIRIKTSANQEPVFEPISVKKFASKEEFISYMVQESIKVWDKYESEKQFDRESQDIVRNIDNGIKPDDEMFADDEDDWVKDFYKRDPLPPDASGEEMVERAKEISERKAGAWEPYLIMREIYGIDLIRPPDTDDEEEVERIRQSRPDPVENNGIFRRATKRRGNQ